MKNLPDKEQVMTQKSWVDIYDQQGVKLSEQDEADITERLTRYFSLLYDWDAAKGL